MAIMIIIQQQHSQTKCSDVIQMEKYLSLLSPRWSFVNHMGLKMNHGKNRYWVHCIPCCQNYVAYSYRCSFLRTYTFTDLLQSLFSNYLGWLLNCSCTGLASRLNKHSPICKSWKHFINFLPIVKKHVYI
jgi:hypothetical protein